MLRLFKNIALLEGVSYLVILTNMLLVKPLHFDLYKTLLFPIGMSHGVLFIAYVILAIFLAKSQHWNLKTLAILLLASLLPFGTFYIDKKYLQHA